MSTPLMQQYASVKAKYPDTILLFRMGDFYETFDDDARTTSKVLGITLTRRGKAGDVGETPLAGFPYHALETYLPKLLKAGLRVAVCEQMEDPKFAKGLVKRDVIEVVTPGVAFSDKILEQKQNNYLACVALPSAIAAANDPVGFSFVDISTGEFFASEFPFRQLPEILSSIAPAELLVQKRDKESLQELLRHSYRGIYTNLDDWLFQYDYGFDKLIQHFKTQSLKGFGIDQMSIGILSAGAVMHYLNETQKANLAHIQKIIPYAVDETIVLDSATKRNLEITSSLGGSPDGTLFSVLDKTNTPMGGRLLKKWVSNPLKKIEQIHWRTNGVTTLIQSSSLRTSLQTELSEIGDMERLIARIATSRANPREMLALKRILQSLPKLKVILSEPLGSGKRSQTEFGNEIKADPSTRPAKNAGLAQGDNTLSEINSQIQPLGELTEAITRAVNDDPPVKLEDGGVIRNGYNKELDELRSLSFSAKDWISNLQIKERERTGISSLKIGFNNVFGYFIEITHTHKDKIPNDYIRKQTMTNAERYITPKLKEYEDKVLNADEKILAIESRLFNELRAYVSQFAGVIQSNAQQIAILDCLVSLAQVAEENKYTLPEVNESDELIIENGRHAVIEQLLPIGEQYIANSLQLDIKEQQILIITGPNMSGKSSYLRQAGLIVLLAHIGSYVPAQRAVIGMVDNIFTRVGASDNITSGESTFLVEMHEAANIVNRATKRSLILLDEVGRGTSTFDGISIAWALTEYLHEQIGARTLFATHYHELNELASLYPRIKNYKVDVKEYGDKVVFLHTVTPGTADHSYGIQVAMMAGLPVTLTDRAKTILENLENSQLTPHSEQSADTSEVRKIKRRISKNENTPQITMFEMKDDELRDAIKKIDINAMTPLDALKFLAKVKENLK
ncbi:MAG: DNA mismatch repair protein MutS [Bacteroidota bacterium]|nr:DNA mismatch repair protein MutS [Bacteroidota bacterium]